MTTTVTVKAHCPEGVQVHVENDSTTRMQISTDHLQDGEERDYVTVEGDNVIRVWEEKIPGDGAVDLPLSHKYGR